MPENRTSRTALILSNAAPLFDRGCYSCYEEGASNNSVRVYASITSATYAEDEQRHITPGEAGLNLCTRCANSRYLACQTCRGVYQSPDGFSTSVAEHLPDRWLQGDQGSDRRSGNETHCRYHVEACTSCSARGPVQNGLCTTCSWICGRCTGRFTFDGEQYLPPGWINPLCYECNELVINQPVSVRGYGRTRPERWFGGPLPRTATGQRQGYYLGFELEISADEDADIRPLLNWEKDNNLEGFFDCKEDSSVSGFEIATQPFTPEFFERMMSDGRWDSFFAMLNATYPTHRRNSGQSESSRHGLHVHIGKVAFLNDDVGMATFAYLLGQDNGSHLERISRRTPTSYCERTPKPVSTVISSIKANRQRERIYNAGTYPLRSSINVQNPGTVEVRSFRSTRVVAELASAVRLVYVAADYARYLRADGKNVDPKRLGWAEFCRWVAFSRPQAFAGLAGLPEKSMHPVARVMKVEGAEWSDEVEPAPAPAVRLNRLTPEPRSMWYEGELLYQINPDDCGDPSCCPNNWTTDAPNFRPVVTGLAAI